MFQTWMRFRDVADWPAALGHLQHSPRGSAPTDSIVRKLFALIARCHQMLGDLPSALNACSGGLRIDPDDAELHFRKAVLHRKAVQPAEAEACWRRILTLKRPDRFCSVDEGIYGHLTLRNLAVLAEERGERAEAPLLWRSVLHPSPKDAEATSRGETWRKTETPPDRQRQPDALSFSKGASERHCQSRCEDETDLSSLRREWAASSLGKTPDC